ncbi:hypothetical protein [Euzebya tangerina]|uniref:hypothetical protein n=1 Tax=Euzebya tangerina TaxID=591198 RepID=UPI0013C36795|nr:hypothetical protein [Euzebya tangerina]
MSDLLDRPQTTPPHKIDALAMIEDVEASVPPAFKERFHDDMMQALTESGRQQDLTIVINAVYHWKWSIEVHANPHFHAALSEFGDGEGIAADAQELDIDAFFGL